MAADPCARTRSRAWAPWRFASACFLFIQDTNALSAQMAKKISPKTIFGRLLPSSCARMGEESSKAQNQKNAETQKAKLTTDADHVPVVPGFPIASRMLVSAWMLRIL